jgi:hypothetical protein
LSTAGIGLKGAEDTAGGRGFNAPDLWDFMGRGKGRADQDVPHNFNFNYTYDLPVGAGRTFGSDMGGVANALLGGWQLNGVITMRSGLPVTIGGGGYSTNNRCRTCRISPNLKPGGDLNPVTGDINHWFDETQFEVVRTGYYGNVGINTMDGPKSVKVDFSVFKVFPMGEARNLQFRAEFFNLPNHPNFSAPAAGVFDNNGVVNPDVGLIDTTNGISRQVQLALKFEF